MGTFIPEAAARRALERCTPGSGGCLISTYSIGSHGYAQVGWRLNGSKNQMTTAHRAAWVAHTGEQIPEGMTVDHTCHVRRCVNPEHLRLLSNLDNARDNAQYPGMFQIPGVALLGKQCRRGHQLIGFASGARYCRECVMPRKAEAKRRRAAA